MDDLFIINAMMESGASFCQVDKIIAGTHLIDVITDGYHKWHGAIPILMINENIKTIFMSGINFVDSHIHVLLKINRLDPSA